MSRTKPFVFIGSSREGLEIAEALQQNLRYECEAQIWSQGFFGLNNGPLESLVAKLNDFDFAILVLTPDDLTESRGKEAQSPRDNVIFELGLFIGSLGRNRVFMLVDKDANAKLPSDLAGIMPAEYEKPRAGVWQSALGPACTELKNAIRTLGMRKHYLYNLLVSPSVTQNLQYGSGISLKIKNQDNKELPPYDVVLRNPHAGTMRLFPSEKKGPLLPTQEREHVCYVVRPNPMPFPIKQLLSHTRHNVEMTESEMDEWTFQVILVDSETVLYENNSYGAAIAKAITKSPAIEGILNVGNEFWDAFFQD